MNSKNNATPWKHGKYTVPTQITQRKMTLLPCPWQSTTGNKFTPVTFQIDTTATYNTLPEDAVLRLMPNMQLKKAPFLLHPYGEPQTVKPLRQIDLLCKRNKRIAHISGTSKTCHDAQTSPSFWLRLRGTGTHYHQGTRNIFPHISSKRLFRQERTRRPSQLVTNQSGPRQPNSSNQHYYHGSIKLPSGQTQQGQALR